jgi:hypothetical protein
LLCDEALRQESRKPWRLQVVPGWADAAMIWASQRSEDRSCYVCLDCGVRAASRTDWAELAMCKRSVPIATIPAPILISPQACSPLLQKIPNGDLATLQALRTFSIASDTLT